jgi:hypothetical protein
LIWVGLTYTHGVVKVGVELSTATHERLPTTTAAPGRNPESLNPTIVTARLAVIPAVTTAGVSLSMWGSGATILNPSAKVPVLAPT